MSSLKHTDALVRLWDPKARQREYYNFNAVADSPRQDGEAFDMSRHSMFYEAVHAEQGLKWLNGVTGLMDNGTSTSMFVGAGVVWDLKESTKAARAYERAATKTSGPWDPGWAASLLFPVDCDKKGVKFDLSRPGARWVFWHPRLLPALDEWTRRRFTSPQYYKESTTEEGRGLCSLVACLAKDKVDTMRKWCQVIRLK